MREISYCAYLGGHDLNFSGMGDSFGFSFFGYNQGFEEYYKQVFGEVKTFEPILQYYLYVKDRMLRNYHNSKLSEPAERVSNLGF